MSLHWKILIGLAAGALWAILSVSLGIGAFTVDWIKPIGDLFIKLLKLIARLFMLMIIVIYTF